MKKEKLILIVGIFFLLFGLTFLLLTPNKKESEEIVKDITEEEAVSIIRDKLEVIIDLHENPSKLFNVEDSENELYLIAKNYKEITDQKFTTKYKSEILKTEINKKKLILTNEENTLILKPIAEVKYIVSSAIIKVTFLNNTKIEAEVEFSDYKLNEKDELEYIIYKKNITLVKSNDLWLVDNFVY